MAGVLESSIETAIASIWPDAVVVSVEPLAVDAGTDGPTHKAAGYGRPMRVRVRRDGRLHTLVLHVETPNDFGHDRRADRAANALLAWDHFGELPGHVRALDVGFWTEDGRLVSLRQCGEPYLLTEWIDGVPYAEDLRRIAADRRAGPRDLERCSALVELLRTIHSSRGTRPAAYARSIRDLLGHGEGIFGIVDGYPGDVAGASAARLEAIERRCLTWRWRLRSRAERLRRTHGDFHPWNVLFGPDGAPVLLDTSRGSQGDPADDVCCMALNYVFFALLEPAAWSEGFRPLWHRFWDRYLGATGDLALLDVAAPFLAWRALVMANPTWYPAVDGGTRDALLGFIERALDAPRVDPTWADELFARGGPQ